MIETIIVFNGKIREGDDLEFRIGDSIVAEDLEGVDFGDELIRVRYVVSPEPIDPEIVEETILRSIMGIVEAEHACVPYTEWTGFVGWDDALRVGDHDLKNELMSYEGQNCYLEFWKGDV